MPALKSQMERPDTSSADWQESLLRSKAPIEKGNTVPLLPVFTQYSQARQRSEAA